MAQTLHPLYGSPIDDSEVARSVGLPPGVYEGFEPTIAGAGGASGWTANLAVDTRSGRSLWRTAGDLPHGRFLIEEDAAIQLPIAAPDASPRIDLIIGIHKWAEGPIDPVTLRPTGAITAVQRPVYAVVKGTAASNPVDPAVADPYDANGKRAVILARVRVPSSGSATIERYDATDMRLEYMRALCADVVQARSPFPSLKSRLDSIGQATQVESMSFGGIAPATGSNTTFSTFSPTTAKKYGSAISQRDASTFGLMKEGLYEIFATYRVDSHDVSSGALGLKAMLNYNGGSLVTLDKCDDTNQQEYTGTLYAQVYVDANWTDPYIYFQRAGWPSGSLRGSIKYLGTPLALQALGISTGNLTIYESGGQTYPDSYTQGLQAANAVGAVTWAVVSGGGALDGTSEPKAEIVNGNQLKITWDSQPGSFPASYTVTLRVTDSASTPRTVDKAITITLNAAQALSISNSDFSISPASYPHTVTFQPIAAGGQTPYTWSIVAGADTTLTDAAYSGATGLVTGTVSANGTPKVRLRVTDGAAAQVEKVINITSSLEIPPDDEGGCVPAGTLFEAVDGSVMAEKVAVGMTLRAYDDATLEHIEATVEEVFVYHDREMVIVSTDLRDLLCSKDHRPWRQESRKTRGVDPHWPPAEELLPGDRTLVEVEPGTLEVAVVTGVRPVEERMTVYHVRLSRGHVYIAGGFPAHNMKAAQVPNQY